MALQKMTDEELSAIGLPNQSVVESGNGIIDSGGFLNKSGWRPLQLAGTNSTNTLLYNKFTDGTNTVFTATEQVSDANGVSFPPYSFYREV